MVEQLSEERFTGILLKGPENEHSWNGLEFNTAGMVWTSTQLEWSCDVHNWNIVDFNTAGVAVDEYSRNGLEMN